MATELQKHRAKGSPYPNITTLRGHIVIGAAGAVSSQSGQRDSGITWAKGAADGQYTGTLHRAYRRVKCGRADVHHATASTAPTLADGNWALVQGVSAAMFAGTAGCSTVTIQTVRTDTNAKANPTNGVIITYEIVVSDSDRQ